MIKRFLVSYLWIAFIVISFNQASQASSLNLKEFENCANAPSSCYEFPGKECSACIISGEKTSIKKAYQMINASNIAYFIVQNKNKDFKSAYHKAAVLVMDCFDALDRTEDGKIFCTTENAEHLPSSVATCFDDGSFSMRPNTLLVQSMKHAGNVPEYNELNLRTKIHSTIGSRILKGYNHNVNKIPIYATQYNNKLREEYRKEHGEYDPRTGHTINLAVCKDQVTKRRNGAYNLLAHNKLDYTSRYKDACMYGWKKVHREFGLMNANGSIDKDFQFWFVPIACPKQKEFDLKASTQSMDQTKDFVKTKMSGQMGCKTSNDIQLDSEKSYEEHLGCKRIGECIKDVSSGKLTARKIAEEVAKGNMSEMHLNTLLDHLDVNNPRVSEGARHVLNGYQVVADIAYKGMPKDLTKMDIPLAAKYLNGRLKLIYQHLSIDLRRARADGSDDEEKLIRKLMERIKVEVEKNEKNYKIGPGEIATRYSRFELFEKEAQEASRQQLRAHNRRISRLENTADVLVFVKNRLKDGATILAGVVTAPCGGCGAGWMSAGLNGLDKMANDGILEGGLKSPSEYVKSFIVEGTVGHLSAGASKLILARGALPILNNATQAAKTLLVTETLNVGESALIGCYHGIDGPGCVEGMKQTVKYSYTTLEGWTSRATSHVINKAIYNTTRGQKLVRAGSKREQKRVLLIDQETKSLNQARKWEGKREKYRLEAEASGLSPKQKAKKLRLANEAQKKYIESLESAHKATGELTKLTRSELKQIKSDTKQLVNDAKSAAKKLRKEAKRLKRKSKKLKGHDKDNLELQVKLLEKKAQQEDIRARFIKEEERFRVLEAEKHIKEVEDNIALREYNIDRAKISEAKEQAIVMRFQSSQNKLLSYRQQRDSDAPVKVTREQKRSEAEFVKDASAYLKMKGVPHKVVNENGRKMIQVLPGRKDVYLSRIAKGSKQAKKSKNIPKIYLDPRLVSDKATASYNPSRNSIQVPVRSIKNLSEINSSVQHELRHWNTYSKLKRGVESPYHTRITLEGEGSLYLTNASYKRRFLTDEMNTHYKENLRASLKRLDRLHKELKSLEYDSSPAARERKIELSIKLNRLEGRVKRAAKEGLGLSKATQRVSDSAINAIESGNAKITYETIPVGRRKFVHAVVRFQPETGPPIKIQVPLVKSKGAKSKHNDHNKNLLLSNLKLTHDTADVHFHQFKRAQKLIKKGLTKEGAIDRFRRDIDLIYQAKAIPKSVVTKDTIIMDANGAIALRKRANGEQLQEGHKRWVKHYDQYGKNADFRVTERAWRETARQGNPVVNRGIELTVSRASKGYKRLFKKLKKIRGEEDRQIVTDLFFMKVKPGDIPTFVTSDNKVYNRLYDLSAHGKDTPTDKLGRPVADVYPNGFHVTLNGQTVKVIPLK